nr:hypothetical protein Iba_chr05dCG10900 [Ipomoea batatas]
MLPRPRKKSIAQKPAPAAQPKTTPLHDLKNFERYKFFSKRRIFQPYILSLVDSLAAPQLTEEERDNRVTNVGNTQAFGGTHGCHSGCGWYDVTSSVNHSDMLCLYGMVKRIILVEPKSPGMQPLAAVAVERMRDKIRAKRARTAATTDVRMEEEAYDAHPDAAGPAHVGAGKGSSSRDFHQQVLAQLAVMNMKVDHIYTRMDAIEAANAQSREEAHAYYEWMRGHYPPPGSP